MQFSRVPCIQWGGSGFPPAFMSARSIAVRSLLPALLLGPLPPAFQASAFQFPMTRAQRAQKLVEEGLGHILHGEYFQAIDSCTRALSIRDDWAPAYNCRGEARMRVKDPQADQDARRAESLDPKSGEPYRLLGQLEYEAGKLSQAIRFFDRALSRSKLHPEKITDIYYHRARAKTRLGDLGGALQDVARGLGILQGLNGDYADWSFHSLRAEILRRQGRGGESEADERRVVSLIDARLRRRPWEAMQLLPRRAQARIWLRRYQEAARDYGEMLALDPDNVPALLGRARANSLAGRTDQELFDPDRALRMSPDDTQALGAAEKALRLAHHHRLYLDSRPLDADLAELLKSKRLYERAERLAPLDAGHRLDRARTLIELALRFGTDPALHDADPLREASSDCAAVLRREPNNVQALALRRLIRERLSPKRPRPS